MPRPATPFPPWRRPPRRPRLFSGPAIGGLAPYPLLIPYSWLQPPLTSRPDKPITSVSASQVSAGLNATAVYRTDSGAQAEYGDNNLSVSLQTACTADPANFAAWTLTYYATQAGSVPRTRFSQLTIFLSKRTDAEKAFLLDNLYLGRRIRITGTPATWAAGATEQVVEGVHHVFAQIRQVQLMTSPVIGSSPGVAGPWFRVDSSTAGGSDNVPF